MSGELSFRGGDPIVTQADGDDRFCRDYFRIGCFVRRLWFGREIEEWNV